jgi:hypothetical protein
MEWQLLLGHTRCPPPHRNVAGFCCLTRVGTRAWEPFSQALAAMFSRVKSALTRVFVRAFRWASTLIAAFASLFPTSRNKLVSMPFELKCIEPPE